MSIIGKQRIRNFISYLASYLEIIISVLVLIGITLLSFKLISDISGMVTHITNQSQMILLDEFLKHAFELIIAVEFIKMIMKHTASSAIELILFAIARQIITSHGSMLGNLLGVIAMTILFILRNYLSNSITELDKDEAIVNASFSLDEIARKYRVQIAPEAGNTAAGIISNFAKAKQHKVKSGYKVTVEGLELEVYSMDANLIKQVRIKKI